MNLTYNYLKKKYLSFFDYDIEYLNFVVTDALFGYSQISKYLKDKKIKRVCEVGSGTGILLNELQNKYPKKKFVGIDPGESGYHNYRDTLTKIGKKNKNISFIKKNITSLNTPKKFDLIFSINVFEHVKDQKKYINKTLSMLNKNGKIVIFSPNYDFPYEPHFVIPIIINKKITEFFFKDYLIRHEKKTKEIGLWKGLNISGKREIEKFLLKKKLKYFFDKSIKDQMFERVTKDKIFEKRQGLAAKLTKIFRFFFLDKLIFDILKIPFPYMELVIKK